jgi:hypothetical protein
MHGFVSVFTRGSRHVGVQAAATILLASAVRAGPQLASQPTPSEALWTPPVDIDSRDLYRGPGGDRFVPDENAAYAYEKSDTTGHSRGFWVQDSEGRRWKVKIGDEAQPEIVASRILWAIGYHQPVLHYVRSWRMTGGPTAAPGPGRFRLESDHHSEGSWAWEHNPFAGSREERALVVVNILLNNWDLAASNNRVYREKHGGGTRYVVQDLGASLGRTRWPVGTRHDVDGFERQGFVERAGDGRVAFDFHSHHGRLLEGITAADVAWACGLLARLSERQLHDAFRAAAYPDDVAERYVRKIREKIAEGIALGPSSEGTR